jgi:hypothetical protein
MKKPRTLPLLALFALVASPYAAAAPKDAARPNPAGETLAPVQGVHTVIPARPLSIYFHAGDRKVDRAALVRALESELGQSVTLTDTSDAALRVEIVSRDRVSVAYRTPDGQTLSRSVDLPAEEDRAVEVIAWLSGNLARNEAAELLRSLRGSAAAATPEAHAAESAASTSADPPPNPKPTPKPDPQSAKTSPARDSAKPKQPDLPPLVFNASVFHPLAIFSDSDSRSLNLELGLAYSNVGAINGAGLALGVLDVERGVRGFGFGGLWLASGGDSRGVLLSNIGTYRAGSLFGAEIGGITTLGHGPLDGIGIAGIFALSGPVRGGSISGVAAVGEGVTGIGIAGVASIQKGDTTGGLISGVFNYADNVDGVAIAGVMNHSGTTHGLQIGGVVNSGGALDGLAIATVNLHGKVRGLQLGIVNVAEEVEGGAIGIVSIAGNGRVQPIAYASSFAPANAGVKFLVGYGYSELSMGFAGDEFLPGGGAGVHIPVWENVYLEPGVHFSTTHRTDEADQNPTHGDFHYRLRAGVRLLDSLELFGGGGVRHGTFGETKDEWKPELLAGIALF